MTTLESSMNSINTYINEMLKCVEISNLKTWEHLPVWTNEQTQPQFFFTITFMSSDF